MHMNHLSLNPRLALAIFLAGTLFIPMAPAAQEAAPALQGIPPRAAVKDYPVQSSQENLQIGAALLTKKDLKQTFATDVDLCCVVVEIGFYPAKDKPIKISSDDFVLRAAGSDLATRASSARDVARSLETSSKETYHAHGPVVTQTQEIGYGRSTGNAPQDPTNPNRNGIYERSGIGVGVGLGKEQSQPSSSAGGDRQAMETELSQNALPEISSDQPVAGYLYFFIPKKKGKGYELVYTMGDKKIVLALK